MLARVTDGSGPQAVRILGGSRRDGPTPSILFFASIIAAALAVTLPHTYIAADTDSASLVGNGLAERSALHQSREFLGAEDVERLRLDFHSPVNTRGKIGIGGLQVKVLGLLGRFKQAEGEAEVTLVSDGEIGEDEVSSLSRSVEIGHTRCRNASQDGRIVSGSILDTAMGNGTGLLQARIKEEIGVVVESDVLAFFNRVTFDDAEFNNRWRINRSSVAVSFHARTTCTSALWLLQNRQLVPKMAVLSSHTVNSLDHVPLACRGGHTRRCRHDIAWEKSVIE